MLKRYYNVINHDKQDIIFPDIVRRIKTNIISRFKSNGNNIAISRIFPSFPKKRQNVLCHQRQAKRHPVVA